MVNVGKFSKEALASAPPPTTPSVGEVVHYRHVVANHENKWLRFDTLELARQVVPPQAHHKIYSTPDELAFKLGARKVMELGRTFGCKSTPELWAKLQLQAYDPLIKYEEIAAKEGADRKTRGPRPKRYKKKIAYRFQFDPDNQGHQNAYGRMPPQACAIVDLLHELTQIETRPADRRNIFTEEEMQGFINLRKDVLHTKQDPWRIFQYYRGKLITSGFLRFHHESGK